MENMEYLDMTAMALVSIGAINWGLVGVADTNVVESLLGSGDVTTAVYILVGVSGLYSLKHVLPE